MAAETEVALTQSLDEYLEDFGDEEEIFEQQCQQSLRTLHEEANDPRLTEIREIKEADPMERMRDWQIAAEESYHHYQMLVKSTDEDVGETVETSRNVVDLTSMLEEESKR